MGVEFGYWLRTYGCDLKIEFPGIIRQFDSDAVWVVLDCFP